MAIHRTKVRHVASIGIYLSILMASSLASAELTVIYDSGKTQPLAPFPEVFDKGGQSEKGPQISLAPKDTGAGAAELERLLPIHSPGLTPGRWNRGLYNSPSHGHSFGLVLIPSPGSGLQSTAIDSSRSARSVCW